MIASLNIRRSLLHAPANKLLDCQILHVVQLAGAGITRLWIGCVL